MKVIKLLINNNLVTLGRENHGFSDANNQESMQQMLDFFAERLKK